MSEIAHNSFHGWKGGRRSRAGLTLCDLMPTDDPVSVWIDELRHAEPRAAERLWNHFWQRLYESARERLGSETRRVYDEEDAVLSAFKSFCTGLASGRFPDLKDREGLWRLLLSITARKVMHRNRFDQQQRRDVRRNASDPCFAHTVSASDLELIEKAPSREPSPEFAAEFADVYENLMRDLGDAELQRVVSLRLEGFTDAEIARRLKCSRSTVQRRIEIIRRRWRSLELSRERGE